MSAGVPEPESGVGASPGGMARSRGTNSRLTRKSGPRNRFPLRGPHFVSTVAWDPLRPACCLAVTNRLTGVYFRLYSHMVAGPKMATSPTLATTTQVISLAFQVPAIASLTAETRWVTGLALTAASSHPGIVCG